MQELGLVVQSVPRDHRMIDTTGTILRIERVPWGNEMIKE